MREKIIQYLQNMQCEWFPVEWDSFVKEYLAVEFEYEDFSNIKIKFEFERLQVYTKWVGVDGKESSCYFYYGTLNRCKTLILNAVRSVDEPKWKGKWGEILYWLFTDENGIRIEAKPENGRTAHVVWRDGEFQ